MPALDWNEHTQNQAQPTTASSALTSASRSVIPEANAFFFAYAINISTIIWIMKSVFGSIYRTFASA